MVAYHQYNVAAAYSVTLIIYTEDGGVTYCTRINQAVVVPVILDFSTTLTCPVLPDTGKYQVQFNDISTYYPNSTGITWAWNFGGTAGNSTLQNPGPITMEQDVYQVQLEVFASAINVCSITKPVTIPMPPKPDFLVVDPNQPPPAGPFCATQTLTEFVANNNHVHHTLWDFGDGSTFVPLVPSNTIDAQKMYDGATSSPTVILTLYDQFGCTYQSDTTFDISIQNLGGSILPSSGAFFCPGGSGVLTFSSSGTNPSGYLWSSGATTNSVTVNNTGSYYLDVFNSSTGCSLHVPGFGSALSYNIPTLSIVGELTLCEGADILLDGQSGITGPGYTFSWTVTDPQGLTMNVTGSVFSLTGAVAGTYHAELTLNSANPSCQTTASADIVVASSPAPPIITVTPAPPCEDQAVLLSVNPIGNYINWSTGQSNATIQVVASGIYQATLTNAAGCTASSSVQVLDNPYLDWFTTGCYEFCDTADVVIPGSGSIPFYKWEWLIDNVVVQFGGSSPVPDWIIPAFSMTGIHIFSVHLEVQNPSFPGQICSLNTPSLEITFKNCPCHAQPKIKLYCVTPQVNDGLGPHIYHFIIDPDVQIPCTATAQVQVTSLDGGVTLLPSTIQPLSLEGFIQTSFSAQSQICFNLDITDPNEPACNCLFNLCHKLPECLYPNDCEAVASIVNVVCVGINNGHPVYSFDYQVTFPGTSYPLFVNFNAVTQGILGGLNSVMVNGPGTFVWSGTIEDFDISDGFCIEMSVYDFNSHTICTERACENNPPANCRLGYFRNDSSYSGIDLLNKPAVLRLLPNPTQSETTLEYSLSAPYGRLVIYDMSGRVIREWNLIASEGRLVLDASAMEPGIYLCTLKGQNGMTLIKKLLVM